MHILVVGGAGYIGSHIVLDLLERGRKVTVFDNLSTGSEENLFKEARFVKGDILAESDLDRLFEESSFDAVIHLAALKAAGDSMNQPERYARHNIIGSLNLLTRAGQHGIRYFLFSSTAAVYGIPNFLPVDESHPCNPTNFYGVTKLQFEQQLAWFSRLKGFRFGLLRYFNAAGYDPKGRVGGIEMHARNLIPVVMETAAGKRDCIEIFGDDYPTRDGTCIRDYVHVSDLAQAHAMVLEYMEEKDQNLVINLGTEAGYSVKEVIAITEQITGKSIPIKLSPRRPGDPATVVATAAKAQELLGWEPRHSSLEEIIATTWAIYQHL